MSATTFYFLVIVCAVQFAIISYILGHTSSFHLIQKGVRPNSAKEDALRSMKFGLGAIDNYVHSALDLKRPYAPELAKFAAIKSSIIPTNNSDTLLRGVAVFISTHHPTWFQRRYTLMAQNIKNNLPQGWKLQIFHFGSGQSKAGLDINSGLERMIDRGDIIVTVIPESLLKKKRKMIELITEPWIWQNMAASRVLLFGGNAVICSNSMYTIEDFADWDYIGAPWSSFKGYGGEAGTAFGGINMRNRDAMLKVIDYEMSKAAIKDDAEKASTAYLNWIPDDIFFVSRMLEMNKKGLANFKLPPRNITQQFAAIGSVANTDVLVASGTLAGLSFKDRDQFLISCPELKMLFPSLHNPSCFGATPDADKCRATICALEVPRRRGGC